MAKIKFNYSQLRGRIIEKLGSQQAFAMELGLGNCSISMKLNGHTSFSQEEIARAIKILDIDPAEVSAYFFTV